MPASSSPRPRPSVAPRVMSVAAMFVAATAACALAGCGTPPELRPGPGTPVPRPATPSPTGGPSALPTGVPTNGGQSPAPTASGSVAPSFAEGYAASCNGYPSGNQVIALLRRTGGLLPGSGTVPVTTGPLCAGTWQYTVLAVPNHDPLAVVTKGTPEQLTLVTAGTDVCSIPVRTAAPAGILNAALCPPPGST